MLDNIAEYIKQNFFSCSISQSRVDDNNAPNLLLMIKYTMWQNNKMTSKYLRSNF